MRFIDGTGRTRLPWASAPGLALLLWAAIVQSEVGQSAGELAITDKAELACLNQQPTSFVLPAEAVDRLRAAAGTIIMSSPEFQRLLKDTGAKVVAQPPVAEGSASTNQD